MARTPSSASKSNHNHTHFTQIRTPQPKHKLHFNPSKPSPNPNNLKDPQTLTDHPVEVIGRIRNLVDPKQDKPSSCFLQISPDHQTIRVTTDIGCRNFTLDGVSSSEEDDLEEFYKKFIRTRILGVKMGDKCTVMMYGPTGSGKSHTMFGCGKLPGIVYRSLKDILSGNGEEEEGDENEGSVVKVGTFVQVSVLEIYNEEIYDLLSCDKGGGGFHLWSKGSASKVKLEVMGKKAKNATFISGNEAGKILKEIQKVEKRRIVKSTNCNDRSSRSHCMIILDVPTVGGRLMLVDMAGSENIEQAGQVGLEAKMQTAKINQGNTALKRVVESIANGDSHVPFRDSKLTMLLQDSFEDDKSKILMVLCASPDPKEMHKTISTLEYGAKAKCIVRGAHFSVRDKPNGEDSQSSSAVALGSRIAAMDQFILQLQTETKLREKECNEARKQLTKKEEEVAQLRAKLERISASEEVINEKVNERTRMVREELEKQLEECRRMANEYVEMEKRRMEEKFKQQQQEMEFLRRRLEEVELELRSRDGSGSSSNSDCEFDGIGLVRRLKEVYQDEDPGMEKSMDIDMGDQDNEVKIIGHGCFSTISTSMVGDSRAHLSTVFEEEEVEEDNDEDVIEVEKKVIEEKTTPMEQSVQELTPTSRKARIQNIFTLCGNYRELSSCPSQKTPVNTEKSPEKTDQNHSDTEPVLLLTNAPENATEVARSMQEEISKENVNPLNDEKTNDDVLIEMYVKWEATEKNPGKFITKLKVVRDATLADLRKLIEMHLGIDKQDFTFLMLGDPTGGSVSKEKEATMLASKLPSCSGQIGGHLACLRPVKGGGAPAAAAAILPFTSLENKLPATPVTPSLVKKVDDLDLDSNLGSTPFITLRRY